MKQQLLRKEKKNFFLSLTDEERLVLSMKYFGRKKFDFSSENTFLKSYF